MQMAYCPPSAHQRLQDRRCRRLQRGQRRHLLLLRVDLMAPRGGAGGVQPGRRQPGRCARPPPPGGAAASRDRDLRPPGGGTAGAEHPSLTEHSSLQASHPVPAPCEVGRAARLRVGDQPDAGQEVRARSTHRSAVLMLTSTKRPRSSGRRDSNPRLQPCAYFNGGHTGISVGHKDPSGSTGSQEHRSGTGAARQPKSTAKSRRQRRPSAIVRSV